MKTEAPNPLRIDFHLLDRQIVDRDGNPVGKVDDIELTTDPHTGQVRVTALLSGQRILGDRIGGRLGRWMATSAHRLAAADHTPPLRIDITVVHEIGSAITLSIRRELLAAPPLETWLTDHLITRIPGAGDAGQ
jgi:sporulation protein YlmC with PRC-barrel domain